LIRNGFTNPGLCPDLLADSVDISGPYLRRLFKAETGMPLHDYINEWRLHKSIEYLQLSQLTVAEIAEESGFFNATYFSTLF